MIMPIAVLKTSYWEYLNKERHKNTVRWWTRNCMITQKFNWNSKWIQNLSIINIFIISSWIFMSCTVFSLAEWDFRMAVCYSCQKRVHMIGNENRRYPFPLNFFTLSLVFSCSLQKDTLNRNKWSPPKRCAVLKNIPFFKTGIKELIMHTKMCKWNLG